MAPSQTGPLSGQCDIKHSNRTHSRVKNIKKHQNNNRPVLVYILQRHQSLLLLLDLISTQLKIPNIRLEH